VSRQSGHPDPHLGHGRRMARDFPGVPASYQTRKPGVVRGVVIASRTSVGP
jgi:hypothetical protein